jgi:hypothetical protein
MADGILGRRAWKRGDRVLAPWEPTYLYAGTVEQLAAGRALIQFDDGDSGWVDLELVQPLTLRPGQKVMSRRRMGPHFFPGEVREVEGEDVHVEFDDGKEERTTVAALRIPCEPRGRGAEQVKATSHTAFLDRLQEGDRVWALWGDAALFPGTVSERRGGEAHIDFDDGDEAWVRLEQLMPLEFIVGMFVMARWRMGAEFYPGRIADTEGDRVLVHYEDGDEEWTTAAALALPMPPPEAAGAAPIIVRQGWDPRTVVWVGGLIVAFVGALCYWLGQR